MNLRRLLCSLGALATATLASLAAAAPSEIPTPRTVSDLPPQAREVFDFTLAQNEREWDPAAFLLGTPARDGTPGRHGIRHSSLYVPALLFRDAPGDRARAAAVIDAILAQQINEPGAPYHGTFYRRAQDPRLQPGAKMWKDYDPNWRQFIGAVWAHTLLQDADKITPETREKILRSLVLALEGELGERRLWPGYTNIALMHAFGAQVAGRLAERPDLFAVRSDPPPLRRAKALCAQLPKLRSRPAPPTASSSTSKTRRFLW
jgi:hypothetical protein